MKVTVIGAGYVGLVTGISIAQMAGHRVTFVERSAERFQSLRNGIVPISEPGLQETYSSVRDLISVTESLDQLADQPDLFVVAVATPIGDDGEPDLSQLYGVSRDLQRWPSADVCVRSTLPPGTSAMLPRLLGREDGCRLSTNPEFLRQGSAMFDFTHPSRVVVGQFPATTGDHLARVHELYRGIDAPRLLVTVQAAELIKNVANGFLALKLSFVNEVASLSEEYGVDVGEVLEGIALDPRIGSVYMQPGLGFGGSCLPKELMVLAAAGRRQGLAMHIARAASLVNVEQQDRFARHLLRDIGGDPATVALLGLSFKGNTDDLRGSPAVTVGRRVLEAGHRLVAHDPAVQTRAAVTALPGVIVKETVAETVQGADAVVVATDWDEYRRIDWTAASEAMNGDLVYDGRNLFDPLSVVQAGLRYRGVGRRLRTDVASVPVT